MRFVARGERGGRRFPLVASQLARAIAKVDELKDAQAALDGDHPWRATQIIAPLLRDPARRTPVVILVAARAAAGWGGWSEVERLLAKESWIDDPFDGEARELLTRSALERGADTAALTHARAAFAMRSREVRSRRLVLLARALERNNMFDSAAAAYSRAAESFRPVRDWLTLRAAGSESDSASVSRCSRLSRFHLPGSESRGRTRKHANVSATPWRRGALHASARP